MICEYCLEPAVVVCIAKTLSENECVAKRCLEHACRCIKGKKMSADVYLAGLK
jgi:hypothetical protein